MEHSRWEQHRFADLERSRLETKRLLQNENSDQERRLEEFQATSVQIKVCWLSGDVVSELSLPGSALVHDVRTHVAKVTKSSAGRLQLVYGGNTLDDKDQLHDLSPGSSLQLELVRLHRKITPSIKGQKHDLVYKLLVVGSSGSGKTCLISRFAYGVSINKPAPTTGVEFVNKDLVVDGEVVVKLRLWDTPGSCNSNSLQWPLGCHAALVTIDISDQGSLQAAEEWLTKLRHQSSVAPVLLVAAKADLTEKRLVSTEQVAAFARQHNVEFYETSATAGQGIEEPFHAALDALLLSNSHPGRPQF